MVRETSRRARDRGDACQPMDDGPVADQNVERKDHAPGPLHVIDRRPGHDASRPVRDDRRTTDGPIHDGQTGDRAVGRVICQILDPGVVGADHPGRDDCRMIGDWDRDWQSGDHGSARAIRQFHDRPALAAGQPVHDVRRTKDDSVHDPPSVDRDPCRAFLQTRDHHVPREDHPVHDVRRMRADPGHDLTDHGLRGRDLDPRAGGRPVSDGLLGLPVFGRGLDPAPGSPGLRLLPLPRRTTVRSTECSSFPSFHQGSLPAAPITS